MAIEELIIINANPPQTWQEVAAVGRSWPGARECVQASAFALLFGFCAGAMADEFSIGGSGATLGTLQNLATEFTAKNPDIRITTVPSLGSAGGVRALVAGAIGLAATSRPLTDSERKLGAIEVEYARTPFVFAVSTRSKVMAISSAELAAIYANEMTAWADGGRVRVVLRPASDIDTEMVASISPEIGRALALAQTRPGVQFSVNDQDAADDLEKIDGAIGPTSLALIVSEKRRLRALKLDGKEPTLMNAASGVYPYHKRLFLVTGAKRTAAVERFVDFVQSPAGRKILLSNGQWIP